MRAVDIIAKKRDGLELSQAEIEFFINGFNQGEIPDYQAAAWAMAVLLRGMTPRETTDLTLAIAHSGATLDLSTVVPIAVDKHSTGGVGDKTTLVVEPIVSACGLAVGKISGRGLAFSGGTLDKIESIPGLRTSLTTSEFLQQLGNIGLVLAGQTDDLAPADGKLYALRDVTATVPSVPLIASSVMSKKIAAGAQAIVLDIKVGNGAFMATLSEGRALAELMVSIARSTNRKAIAILSDMNQPLGNAVGNTLELREAIYTLHGFGPQDFRQHCLIVAAHMLALGRVARDENHGKQLAQAALDNGNAWERFVALVKAQEGQVEYVEHPNLLPVAPYIETFAAPHSAYLSGINARLVGEVVVLLGGGRAKKGDPIDHAVGVEIFHKVGDFIEAGDRLFTVHARHREHMDLASQMLYSGHTWSVGPVEPLPLIYGVVKPEDIKAEY